MLNKKLTLRFVPEESEFFKTDIQKQPPQVFYKKGVLKKIENLQ